MEVEEVNEIHTASKNNRKLSADILNGFSKITSLNANERIKNSIRILRNLIENQDKEFEEKYLLVRLIRGLGSSKANIRSSYYSVLVAYIALKPSLSIEDILKHVSEQLHRSGSNSKAENADVCTGQILACGAIIRSPLWKTSQLSTQKEILEMMFKASKERTYLPLLAYMFTLAGLQRVTSKRAKHLAPLILNEIPNSKSEILLDSLYLMHCLAECPGVSRNFLEEKLGTEHIFCVDNADYLTSVFVNIPKLSESIHPFYTIASEYLKNPEMWQAFDSYLSIPNRNKHLIITMMFTNILKKIENPQDVPRFFTENFVQLLLDKNTKNFRGQNVDKEFQNHISKFYDALEVSLKQENCSPETRVSVLKKLLFHRGTFVYDKINGSRIILRILVLLETDGVKKLSKSLRKVIKGSEKNYVNTEKLAASHLLIKLINNKTVKEENEWKINQLQMLMNLALFKSEDEDVGLELAESLKKAFFGALDLKMIKIEDMHAILTSLVREIDSKISSDNLETVLRDPITPEQYQIWQKTVDKISKIEQKIKNRDSVKVVFFTLFLHMGIQIFNEPKLAVESLNELFECYQKAKADKKQQKLSQVGDNTEPAWIDVVVELFLSWLSRTSHLLRSIVNIVFPYAIKFITASTVHQILSVLDPDNKDLVMSKSFNRDEEDSEDDTQENDDNEEDDAVENDDQGVAEEDEEEEEESDSEIEDEDMEKETANDKLRMALHQVLNDKAGSDAESVDLDALSDTEADKLDEALTDVFRQFKPNLGNRKKQGKDDEALMHFRIRALDLIEIFLGSTPSLAVVLEMILPLLQAIEYSIRERHHKPLLDRLERCLKKLPKLKCADADAVPADVLTDLLVKLLDDETKTNTIKNYLSKYVPNCALFIIKHTEAINGLPESFAETLVKELKKFFKSRENATAMSVFRNLLQRNWIGIQILVPHILEAICDEEMKIFKKNQAVELARLFYNNNRYLKDDLEQKKSNLSRVHREFSAGIVKLLEKADEKYLVSRFAVNLLNLLRDMKKCPLNIEEIQHTAIAEAAKGFERRLKRNNLLSQMVKNYCKCVDVSYTPVGNNANPEGDKQLSKKKRKDSDISQGGSKNKKKKNKSVL